MNKLIPVYRIVGYILIVIAGILGLGDLLILLGSLGNPLILIEAFIVIAVIIYSFASFNFYNAGVQKGKVFKRSFRDLVNINAYITLLFAIMTLASTIMLVANPASLNDYNNQVIKAQSSYGSVGLTKQYLMRVAMIVMYISIAYSILLLFHVMVTLKLLKQYSYLFGKKDEQQQ